MVNSLERVLEELRRLETISDGGPGVTRLGYSSRDAEAREWFATRCSEAGLRFEADRAGNCFGWAPAATSRSPLLIGSHLDSVIQAGPYDGIVGVVVGLQVVQEVLAENPNISVGVASFACEESTRFGFGTVGSRLLTGELSYEKLDQLIDRNGDSLASILERAGLMNAEPIVAGNDFISSYLEVHIDQGTLLSSMGHSIGIVDTIAGLTRTRLTWEGEPSHSGGRRRGERRDALLGAARFITRLDDLWESAERDGFLVMTVGQLTVEPNSPNTVPGRVDMILDVRAIDPDLLRTTVDDAKDLASRVAGDSELDIAFSDVGGAEPVDMSVRIRELLDGLATGLQFPHSTIPSFAGHDAMVIGKRFPSAMILIANPSGKSHSPDEAVDEQGIAQAVEVLRRAVLELGR